MMNQSMANRRNVIRSMFGGSLLMPGAITSLLAAENANQASGPHFPATAKRMIMIYATGGVSHIDTFDPKSTDNGRDGTGPDRLAGNFFGSERHAKCGTEVSNLFPYVREVIDEVCVIRTMRASHFDHSEATLGMHTGSPTFTRPSMGSWLSYGLGTINENLPAFMVIAPFLPYAGSQVYASDFLPARHQGTRVIPGDNPIANLHSPLANPSLQQLELDLTDQLNRRHANQRPYDTALKARIKAFETAFEMQRAAPEAFDLSQEPSYIRELYGIDRKMHGPGSDFAWQCLVARRLAERGVRFIELIDTGSRPNWDSHGDMKEHADLAMNVDQPIAALITDLRQRGMLDETVVFWATEFGRTPQREGKNGRGHHRDCFSVWLAGGGFKGGHVHGVTDEIGKYPLEDSVEVHDLHATILHQMGIDHERLTFRHAGRDFRLTDVHGRILRSILA